jgi:metal-responsive CopG/Arc/MetJ family transcriptional regulator
MDMARKQVLVQFTEDLLARLDEHAARLKRSRSELIREAVEAQLDESVEAEIDRRIVEGYTRVPPQQDQWADRWAQTGARDMLREESW